ncbi:hypothetical protein CYMTET_14991, partial [Cymbomonas tetramitiformis]
MFPPPPPPPPPPLLATENSKRTWTPSIIGSQPVLSDLLHQDTQEDYRTFLTDSQDIDLEYLARGIEISESMPVNSASAFDKQLKLEQITSWFSQRHSKQVTTRQNTVVNNTVDASLAARAVGASEESAVPAASVVTEATAIPASVPPAQRLGKRALAAIAKRQALTKLGVEALEKIKEFPFPGSEILAAESEASLEPDANKETDHIEEEASLEPEADAQTDHIGEAGNSTLKEDAANGDGDLAIELLIVFPQKQGVTLTHYGYDTKQDSRLGQLTAEYSQTLYGPEKFNSLRIPLRGAYYPEWEYDTCPWNGHPSPGVVNPEAYECSVHDITNARSADPGVVLFASLKMAYYDGTFHPYLPDRCYSDGEVQPAAYAQLIVDFLNHFSALGIVFDYLGIENESGDVPPEVFSGVMAELDTLQGQFTWPTQGMVYPETYSPSSGWMREVAKLGTLSYLGASGIHYYGDEREHTNDEGRLTLREKLTSWKGSVPAGTPKWQTE